MQNPDVPTCSADGCDQKVNGRGLCKSHLNGYYRQRPDRPKCVVANCEKLSACRGYCKMHHSRLLTEGSPGEAHARQAPKGSGSINGNGYRVIRANGEAVLEHRLVMEKVIGRALLNHEEVHHLNGDRADNRPENLELWSHSQPSGQRVMDKVRWAKELLRLYEPEALRGPS